ENAPIDALSGVLSPLLSRKSEAIESGAQSVDNAIARTILVNVAASVTGSGGEKSLRGGNPARGRAHRPVGHQVPGQGLAGASLGAAKLVDHVQNRNVGIVIQEFHLSRPCRTI